MDRGGLKPDMPKGSIKKLDPLELVTSLRTSAPTHPLWGVTEAYKISEVEMWVTPGPTLASPYNSYVHLPPSSPHRHRLSYSLTSWTCHFTLFFSFPSTNSYFTYFDVKI